jgi:DNA-binding NarL/FixJ family response regulator
VVIQVAVRASTPLTHAGLIGLLRASPDLTVLPEADDAAADVAVVCGSRLNQELVAMLRCAPFFARAPVVLVVAEITEPELRAALGHRVVAILPRAAATADRLTRSVRAAAESPGVMPPHAVRELRRHIERLRSDNLTPHVAEAGLTRREIDVLRLMADGLDSTEVASELRYSERTVKKVIHGVTRRLSLRNRSHAVAYAVRAGLI